MKKVILKLMVGLLFIGSTGMAVEQEWMDGKPVQTDTSNQEWIGGRPYIYTETTTAQVIFINMD